MKLGILIQARMNSTRMPNKVMTDMCGKPMLLQIINRVKLLKEDIVVITSVNKKDNVIESLCKKESVLYYRGSEEDVLDRFYKASSQFGYDHIVRLTADNPFVSIKHLDVLITEHLKRKVDYSTSKWETNSGLPRGVGAEIFTYNTLDRLIRKVTEPHHREHINDYIIENREEFNIYYMKVIDDFSLSVDTEREFRMVEAIMNENPHLYLW